jgi:sugar/nucleoside kinase (ribokinase family)
MKIKKILCIGAALNDLLVLESDAFISALGREKGGMALCDHGDIQIALSKIHDGVTSAPGGSACNTGVGLARLGADVTFLGKRGKDTPGENTEKQLHAWGLKTNMRLGDDPTGQVLSIITPDAQRTMMTCLGAAATLAPEDLSLEDFEGFDLVHLEGYLLFNTPFFDRAVELAKEAGCKISFDLSSFEVVGIFKEKLESLLPESIDLIIANEDEAKAYSEKEPEESLEIFAGMAEMAVVKLGKDGALLARGEERVRVGTDEVKALDTTGAGDLWASGYLYGLSRGWSLERSGALGAQTGAAVVQIVGAVIPDDSWEKIIAGVA